MKTCKVSQLITLLTAVWTFFGCVPLPKKFHGLKPVYPEPAYAGRTIIDTLQPELVWEPYPEPGVTYDLVLWDKFEKRPIGNNRNRYFFGEPKYYVEALKDNRHKITIQLEPRTLYYWSVRIRKDGRVSDWSTYSEKVVGFGGTMGVTGKPFHFETR